MKKELCVTSDFLDDLLRGCQVSQIDDIMEYAASLGAVRFEWIIDKMWDIYDQDQPLGYDVLKEACDAAHRHGMRFDAVFKPFESGSKGRLLPFFFPHCDDDRIIKTENGLLYVVRPFVADNPEYRIARKKGDGEDPGGNLAEVRLVHWGEDDIGFSAGDVSFWYSETNGNFKRYEGKLETALSKEWRLNYPYDDKLSTIMHFKGFDLPESVKYIEVRCAKRSKRGSFANAIEKLVELVNDRGEIIPSAPSTVHSSPEKIYEKAKALSDLGIVNYLKKPEVRALLADFDTFNRQFQTNSKGMYNFQPQWETFTLDREDTGVIAVCRGKPPCHPTMQHPIYPEVRQNWLDVVQYCIDRGVDGVNIRISRHGGMNEPLAYGFNDPVIEQLGNKDDVYEASLVNGRAFDTFMEDAAGLLHRSHREIGVHLCGIILRSPDKLMATTKPSNFVWNWEKWVRDIVDYAEFHKTNFFKFPHVKQIIDHFGHVVRSVGKPFIYQSGQSRTVTHYDGPHHFLPFEMQWVKAHPHLTCYNLYETAGVCRMNQDGKYEGSPHIKELIRKYWE